jgi:hypothetical protein
MPHVPWEEEEGSTRTSQKRHCASASTSVKTYKQHGHTALYDSGASMRARAPPVGKKEEGKGRGERRRGRPPPPLLVSPSLSLRDPRNAKPDLCLHGPKSRNGELQAPNKEKALRESGICICKCGFAETEASTTKNPAEQRRVLPSRVVPLT